VNEHGDKEPVVMIHAAIAGSLERFTAVLIEHCAGKFPLRFSPVQLAVIPVADAHHEYAKEVAATLHSAGFRVELYDENDSMGKKIRTAKHAKLPYFIVLGDKEVADNTVTLESRDTGDSTVLPLTELGAKLQGEL